MKILIGPFCEDKDLSEAINNKGKMKASEYDESDNISSSSDNLSSSSDNLSSSSSDNLLLSIYQEDYLNHVTSCAPFYNCNDQIFSEAINSNNLNSEDINELNNDLNITQRIIGKHWYWVFKKNKFWKFNRKKIEYDIYEPLSYR